MYSYPREYYTITPMNSKKTQYNFVDATPHYAQAVYQGDNLRALQRTGLYG